MTIKRAHLRKIKTKSNGTRTIAVKSSRTFRPKPCRKRRR